MPARANAATARSISSGVAHVDGAHLHADRRRHILDDGELADPGGYGGISKDGHARHARRDLFEQLQPFRAQTIFELHEAGGVAARPRQAVDEAGADRIGDDPRTQSARCGSPVATVPRRRAAGHDDVRRERDQFRRVFANVVGIACGPARVDPHVAAVSPAQLLPAPAGTPRRAPARPDRPRRMLISTPMRRMRSGCCARAASGHAAAAPPSSEMNWRRFMGCAQGQGGRIKYSRSGPCIAAKQLADVRFGS